MATLGLDIGTTGCKALLLSNKGAVIGRGFREYGIDSLGGGRHEQDAEAVWGLAQEAMREAASQAGGEPVDAVSASVQGDAVIPTDGEGRALTPALLGMDYRSAGESLLLAERFGGRELFARTGMRPHPMNAATKMLWIKNNRPDVYERARHLTTYADFVLMKMGAGAVIDDAMASRTMLYDLKAGGWAEEIVFGAGLDGGKLSRTARPGTAVGEMDPRLKERLGLRGRALLVAGGHDQTCAALGAGVVDGRAALDSHGTAEVVSAALAAPRLDDRMYACYYPCYRHVVDGTFFTFTLNHTGGVLLKWFRDAFCEPEAREAASLGESAYRLLEDRAPDGPADILVLPHFSGSGTPWCDLDSRGAIVGLTLSTTKYDIVKAIMDCLCYEMAINLEALASCGVAVDALRVVGGAARSRKWMQIKADVTGRAVTPLAEPDAAALGAALLAAVGAGAFADAREAAAACVRTAPGFEPNPENVPRYREKYEQYRALYGSLRELNRGFH